MESSNAIFSHVISPFDGDDLFSNVVSGLPCHEAMVYNNISLSKVNVEEFIQANEYETMDAEINEGIDDFNASTEVFPRSF